MQIITSSKSIIRQIIDLCENLNEDQYSASMNLLMSNSIGKHVRHIVEFFDLLKDSSLSNTNLCYDGRKHCNETETDRKLAIKRFKAIIDWLGEINGDMPLKLVVGYDMDTNEGVELPTSLNRELVYNIEHAIHHMAIIRIAIEKEFPKIKLDKHFGVAFSTIRYKDDICAR